MICRNCGREIDENAKFCYNCGASAVSETENTDDAEETVNETVSNQEEKAQAEGNIPEDQLESVEEKVTEETESCTDTADTVIAETVAEITSVCTIQEEDSKEEKKSENVNSEKKDAEEFTPGQRRAVTKIASIMSYFGIWFLVPALVFKDKAYIRQHANNGLVLLIFSTASALVCVIPVIGWIAGAVVGVFTYILSIIGIIMAACGETFDMPIIGKIRILK